AFAGEPLVAGLALDEDQPVGDLAGDRVAQLDLPVDPGVGLPLVPDEPHLVDLLVDQRDPAITGLRADIDLLQRALLSSHAEIVTTAGRPDRTAAGIAAPVHAITSSLCAGTDKTVLPVRPGRRGAGTG